MIKYVSPKRRHPFYSESRLKDYMDILKEANRVLKTGKLKFVFKGKTINYVCEILHVIEIVDIVDETVDITDDMLL